MSVFLFMTFLKERFTSKQNMKWQDEMISFFIIISIIIIFVVVVIIILYYLFKVFFQLLLAKSLAKSLTFARSDIMTSILQRLKRGREPTKFNPGDEVALF